MVDEKDLERASEIADAKLSVAEEFGWPLAMISSVSAFMKWDSWLIAALVGVAVYVLSIHRYRRASDRAEDEYFKAAGLGKYFRKLAQDADSAN